MDPFSGHRRRAPAAGPGGHAGIETTRRNHPRAFIGTLLIVLSAMAAFFTPAAPVLAAGNSCVTSGPGAYTVSACITVPADGASVSGTQTVTGTISVPTGTSPGVMRAVFFLRGAYVLTDYTSPYTFALKTTDFVDGAATLELEADMKDGFASSHASIALTLNNGILTPPINTNTFTARTPAPAAGQPLIVAAAGDGAGGEPNETAATNLIAGMNPDMLLYLGDVYEKGSLTEFENWYGNSSSWYGQFRSKTNPVVGNHEYEGNAAPGYFNYWDNIPHYYSYNDAGWHFIALDSTSQFNQTAPGTAQYEWLANDLATNTQPCTIAYFHHPRYTVGPQGDSPRLDQIWSLFNAWSVDIVLNGHDHDYQRWLPLDSSGNPSPTGVTEFVVGTGGHGIQGFNRIDGRVAKGLDTSPNGIGALKLALSSGSATYQFVSATLGVQDSGSISCTPSSSDTTSPTAPTNLAATPLGANRVDLNWSPATDNVGVVGYDVSRNNQFLCSIPGSSTSYADSSVQPSTPYTYTVSARDLAGNSSPPSLPASATTSGTSVPILIDDFESGGLATWTNIGMVVQGTEVYTGSYAARATTTTAAAWAWHTIANQTNAYFRIRFKVVSQGANNLYLMKVRTSTGTSIGGLYLGDSGNTLNYRNDAGVVTVRSPRTAAAGVWHELQVHLVINGTASQIETWLDGSKVPELSKTDNFGTTPIGRVQIADNSGSRAYDLAIDDLVVDTQFISSAPPIDTSAPSVPGNVTATAASFNRINVAWTPSIDNVGVVEYDLYRNAEPLDVVLGSSTSYADSTVDPGTTYSYTILAKDAAGNQSSASSPAVATTPAIAPGAPTGLTASGSNGLVSLSWTAPASNGGAAITSYKIYRGTTAGGTKTLRTTVTTTSFDDSSVTNGTTYYYTVTAVNPAGEGSPSGEASATPAAVVTVPSAPRNLVATPGNEEVSLSWTAPLSNGGSAITGYTVYRGTVSNGESPTPLIVLGNVTSYTDSGLTNGTTYYYEVTATNVTGEGAASAESSATPASAPGAPTGLGASAGPSQVSLSWTAPSSNGGSAITGYQIWRSNTSGSETLLTTIGVATSYTDTSLTNGTTYFYRVAAVNAIAASGLSNEASATPITVADAATGLVATRGNGQVGLAWTAPSSNGGSAITAYKVYRGSSSGGETLLTTLGNVTSYTDPSLTNGTTYFYEVSAVNGAGEGGLSGEASATPATNPGAPGSLTATAGAGSVGLTWSAAAANGSAVINYKVYRGTTTGGETLLTTIGNVTTYTDSAVASAVTYYYMVSAVNSVDEGAQSTEANATPTAPPPLLTEGFESGSLTGWTVSGPIATSTLLPHTGLSEARDQCAGSACWAWRPFSGGQTASDLWAQAWVYVGSADKNSTNVFKFRTGSGGSGAAVFGIVLNNKGKIGYRNDVMAKTIAGTHLLPTGGWHRITVHLVLGTSGHVDVWLDGTLLPELSRTDNFGTAAIAKMQLGENGSGGTFDVRYDDLNVSASALTP